MPGVDAGGKAVFASDSEVEAVTVGVMPGRVVLELDDGACVELGPGDTVVQNGTRHRWRNPFDEPATLVVVLIGATSA
jgi:quercetin dioxygenase-like cupin family protein